jgi:hypothetical protein
LKNNSNTSATPADHTTWHIEYVKRTKKALGKLISAKALISTQTISIQTEKPTTQSDHMDKVRINKIETQPITGNKKKKNKVENLPIQCKIQP